MKTILFPIRSASKTNELLKYVGSLAQDAHAKVSLISMETSKQKVMAISGTHFSTEVSHSPHLNDTYDYLCRIAHVPSDIVEENINLGDTYKKLGAIADRHDVMIVPLASDYHAHSGQFDLTKAINETNVPLLLIPDEFKYKKIKCLIYAYDFKHEPDPPLSKLSQVASWFGAEVRFISIFSKDALTKERDKVHELHIQLLNAWKGGNKISFDTIVYPHVPKFEEHYLGQPEQGDLQVLSVSSQSFLDRLLRRGLMEGIQHSKSPYLVIHK